MIKVDEFLLGLDDTLIFTGKSLFNLPAQHIADIFIINLKSARHSPEIMGFFH